VTIRNCGIMIACVGIISVLRISRNSAERPAKRTLASAYPASRFTVTDSTVVMTATDIELMNHLSSGNRANRSVKLATVSCCGHRCEPDENSSDFGVSETTTMQ
jgi:hypothetical protein